MPLYKIAGLTVQSEPILLGRPREEEKSAVEIDVSVRFGGLSNVIPDSRDKPRNIETGRRSLVFRPIDGLTFLIRDGREIVIDRAAEITESEVLLFLLGTAFAILFHQRDLLPVHCSAVAYKNRAILFSGISGAGKSTLAAGLARRGYECVCDDVGIIDTHDGKARLQPMPKGLKLWGSAIDALRLTRGPLVASRPDLDKYYVEVPEYEGMLPIEVSALYMLADSETEQPKVSAIAGAEKFECVRSSVYRDQWMHLTRNTAAVFSEVARLANELSVFRFERSLSMPSFERGLDALEDHIRLSTVIE